MSTRSASITPRLMMLAISIVVLGICATKASAAPTIKTVDGEVAQMNTRLSSSYGKLGGEYQALQSQVAGITSAAKADARNQNGKLTATQAVTFTKELSLVGQAITEAQSLGAPSGTWMANHPAAAKVLNSAEQINAELSQDYGSLGGNYISLQLQDDRIRAAAANLAHEDNGLSQGQITKFDSELTNLQNEINSDFQ